MTGPDETTSEVEEEVKEEELELDLVIWPHKGLKNPVASFPLEAIGTPLVRKTADAMIVTMYKYCGVGLAAQQVEVPFQIFVMDANWTKEDAEPNARVFLNPKIVSKGDGVQELAGKGEGCLSFPYDYHAPVRRSDTVTLDWVDYDGVTHREEFEGFESIIIQHEMDHLHGFCFIDRLSSLKRDMAIRKAKKIRRQYKNGTRRAINRLKNAPRTPEYLIKRYKDAEKG